MFSCLAFFTSFPFWLIDARRNQNDGVDNLIASFVMVTDATNGDVKNCVGFIVPRAQAASAAIETITFALGDAVPERLQRTFRRQRRA